MTNEALLDAAEAVYGTVARSFLRYIVESGQPCSTSPGHSPGEGVNEWDRRVIEAFASWYADTTAALVKLEDLLLAEKFHPVIPIWPMEFAQYNYLTPVYLLRPLIQKTEPYLDRLDLEASGLASWPEARAIATELRKEEARHFQEIQELEAARPKDPPRPGVKKGVSANFW